MTKEELLIKLRNIEWDDFEVKEAKGELPKNVWDTVSAFANTSGGWIVLGIHEDRKKGKSEYVITGVGNPEKIEQDFLGTLRSQKFNLVIPAVAEKLDFDGKTVLAFYIPSSEIKPVYFNGNLSNTFIRNGSGDQHATDAEIAAIQRDQAFGSRSEIVIHGTSFEDINPVSLDTYRQTVKMFNSGFAYNHLQNEEFCEKIGVTRNGELTYGSLAMFGKRDTVQRHIYNFWVDYIEIPGLSYNDAAQRYTFRMQEQENLWEYYNLLIQRLRNYTDNPFTPGPNGFSPDDDSQLYCLREGLVNMLAHADMFSTIHSTIRVYSNRIEFQNAGRFIDSPESFRKSITSMPRNPNIIKFFRFAKLAENAGYGIDKIMNWENLTGEKVEFFTNRLQTTVTYYLPQRGGQKKVIDPTSTPQVPHKYPTSTPQVQKLTGLIGQSQYSVKELMELVELTDRKNFLNNYLNPAISEGFIEPLYPDSPNHPKQKYRLTGKGLEWLKQQSE